MAFGFNAHDERAAELGQPTKISFGGMYNHFVLVPVSVNGEPAADFILDTGAPTTVVDPTFAARVGIAGMRSAEGMGAAGAMRASVAQVRSIQVGPTLTESLMVGVVDRFTALRPIVPTVVGSLGIDFLRPPCGRCRLCGGHHSIRFAGTR
ncbi:MAG: retropepsin-like aspartic protease [Candidatus Eremiobacter antarcticus]